MKAAFITNFCPHYRIKTFETLASNVDTDFYFFSAGNEWYWQQQHGTQKGNFHYEYLPGFNFNQTRITPTLPEKLWRGNYSVYIKCINGKFALPITYLIARARHKPFILWTGIWTRLDTPLHRLIYPLTKYIYHHSDAIVVYGEHVRQYLVSEGVKNHKIFTAKHAVDNPFYQRTISQEEKDIYRKKLFLTPTQKIVLFLGRLETVKGLTYLLKAFASLNKPDTVLLLAGTGSEQQLIAKQANDLGISNQVRWAGYVPNNEAPIYYNLASVTVLPSISLPTGKELWGLVVNESFNQGTPVIVTDAVGAGAGGLVQDGHNGLIVPEKDPTSLASALKRVLCDQNLRHTMGENAREKIHTWNNENMVMGFRQAIEFVTKNP